jgi:hypothetical protein
MSLASVKARRIRIPNEEITWAGECAWTDGYCFGTESGRVFFYKKVGRDLVLEFDEVLAEDAINGIAFFNEFIGVSTRSEVIAHRRTSGCRFELLVAGPGGAHGIVATPSGRFLAPMGPEGLFCLDVPLSDAPRPWNERITDVPLNYYALTCLGNVEGKEVLACAGRTDGLLRIQFENEDQQSLITRLTAPGIDFVDVCSLGSGRSPFAIAALCRDQSVILVRDLLTDDQPQTLRLNGIRGTPYSIRCALGHLFVLTSTHVTVFPNLVRWYQGGERIDPPLNYRQRSVEADDMFVARDIELLVLTDGGVDIDDIPKLVGLAVPSNEARPQSTIPDWIEDKGAPEVGPAPVHWLPVPA